MEFIEMLSPALIQSSPIPPSLFMLTVPLSSLLSYLVALVVINTLPHGLTRRERHEFIMYMVFISSMVALILLIVGVNLARAFAIVGILSIIRFRNNVKGSNTFPYYLVSIGIGLACGGSYYVLALESTLFVCLMTFFLNYVHAEEKVLPEKPVKKVKKLQDEG